MLHHVDKRTFLAGASCRTQGWYIHRTLEARTPGLTWRFHAGADVARKAHEWLGPGRMLPRTPHEAALAATREALADPDSTLLFEASFLTGRLAARADALRRDGAGWQLLEVKAGTSPDDGKPPKAEYVDDIAYTAWVARAAGLPLSRLALVLINPAYRLDGSEPPLVSIDVTDAAMARIEEFDALAPEIESSALAESRPQPELRFECKACDFFATECVGAGIPDPLFVLPRLSAKRFDALRHYARISQLPETADLTDNQWAVAHVIRSGVPQRHADGLGMLDDVAWPVAYLDFETVNPHLPWFEARPPYDAVPFQYSLHIRDAFHADAIHRQYLAPSSGDWRRTLVTQLLEELGTRGSIMVYSSYEKVQLTKLAELFPELSGEIAAVIGRLFDLEKVVKHGYIHPGFAGRTSIKKVLPVLVPGLGYDGLTIGNGDDAAGVFALMRVGEIPEHEHQARRQALLEYCHLDTWAMVQLHDALWRLRDS